MAFAIAAIILVPFVLWLLWIFFGVQWVARYWMPSGESIDISKLGQAGDLFGGINALFAAWAFAGVAVAAFFQYKTFRLVEEQQVQQGFEPLFFQLLQLSRELMPRHIGADVDNTVQRLADQFAQIILDSEWFQELKVRPEDSISLEVTAHIEATYAPTYDSLESQFGPFFRSLYHVFKLIDNSGLPEAEQVEYANIARAALPRAILFLLLLNCATPRGREFKALIEKYGVLKNVYGNGETDVEKVAIVLAHNAYSPTATMSADHRAQHVMEQARRRRELGGY